MSRTIAIIKRNTARRVFDGHGSIAPVGSIANLVGVVVPPGIVVASVSGGILPQGDVARLASGPSLVTLPKSIGGGVTPGGNLTPTNLGGGGSDTLTGGGAGSITPVGVATSVIDPFTVKRLKSLTASVAPTGTVLHDVFDVVVSRSDNGTITPTGSVARLAGGPSIVTITQSKSGSITPQGAISSSITTPGLDFSQSVDGSITPAGSLASVIDPFTVTELKSIVGTITPAGTLSKQSNRTVTKSIGGTVTPHATVARLKGGPSFVTKLKPVAGSITPHGAVARVVVPPPVTFFAQAVAGSINPTGNLTKVAGGPSFVIITKLLAGGIAPNGSESRAVSGPSYVTIAKAVSGSIVPHGNASNIKGGTSKVTITQSRSGGITPTGSITNISSGGPSVQLGGVMYTGMYNWIESEFGISPQWNNILVTAVHQSESSAYWQSLFAAMRTRSMKGGPSFSSPADIGVKRADGTLDFSLTKYKALVDKLAAVVGITSYISGGECQIICAGDEPQHAKWNGTWTPDLRKQCCQYIKQRLPGVKVWFRTPARHLGLNGNELPSGGWAGSLDAGCSQWTGPNRGDSGETKQTNPLTYYQVGRDLLASIGLDIVLACNWCNGGDGSSGIIGADGQDASGNNYWVMTTTEIKAAIDAAVKITETPWFTMWFDAHGSNLGGSDRMLVIQDSAPYVSIFQYVKSTGIARGLTNTPPAYYTNTAQHAPVYPPPTIPVGGAVRDALTTHKVFHLLDNARLQSAEYPALNSDNSVLYFVQGGAGMLGNIDWSLATSSVQVGTVRGAFGTGPFGALDGVIWDRGDRRYMYFTNVNAPAEIYRRDVIAGTTVLMKSLSLDPSFVSVWTAAGQTPTTLKLVGLHSSRSQERLVAIVENGSTPLGIVCWDRLTSEVWNWTGVVGKTITRVSIDDIGQYIKVHFSDDSWVILSISTQASVIQSAVLVATVGPSREDNQTNKMIQSDGIGVRSWTFSPASAASTIIYAHPLRNSKTDPYNKGRVSMQAVDEVVYESLFYAAGLTATWSIHSGEIYKLNWATELAAQPNKIIPEEVRQGITRLTKVTTLTNLTTRGQWFYDSTTQTLYARCTDGLSPSTKRMVVFDWRFGTEEVVMVTSSGFLKGRLCHHYGHVSSPTVDVDVFRGACVSYDGSRVLFNSNWGGQPTIGIYCVLTNPTL